MPELVSLDLATPEIIEYFKRIVKITQGYKIQHPLEKAKEQEILDLVVKPEENVNSILAKLTQLILDSATDAAVFQRKVKYYKKNNRQAFCPSGVEFIENSLLIHLVDLWKAKPKFASELYSRLLTNPKIFHLAEHSVVFSLARDKLIDLVFKSALQTKTLKERIEFTNFILRQQLIAIDQADDRIEDSENSDKNEAEFRDLQLQNFINMFEKLLGLPPMSFMDCKPKLPKSGILSDDLFIKWLYRIITKVAALLPLFEARVKLGNLTKETKKELLLEFNRSDSKNTQELRALIKKMEDELFKIWRKDPKTEPAYKKLIDELNKWSFRFATDILKNLSFMETLQMNPVLARVYFLDDKSKSTITELRSQGEISDVEWAACEHLAQGNRLFFGKLFITISTRFLTLFESIDLKNSSELESTGRVLTFAAPQVLWLHKHCSLRKQEKTCLHLLH